MIDEVLARYTNQNNRTLLTDALGSVIAQSDESGAITGEYSYSPFGETVETGEISDNPLQYTGRENDGSGLYYYRARYYDPGLKRFISRDPIGLEGGINVYLYALANPIRWFDSTGKAPTSSQGTPSSGGSLIPPRPSQGVPTIEPPKPIPPAGPGRPSCEFLHAACMARCFKLPICKTPIAGKFAKAGCAAACTAVWLACRAGGGE